MRVGVDIRALQTGFKGHAGRGIGTMVLELLRRLPETAPDTQWIWIAEGGAPLVGEATDLEILRVPCPTLGAWPLARRQIRHQLLYPRALARAAARHSLDALFFPCHLDAPAASPLPSTVCVQDLIPERWPALYPADWKHPKHALARRIEHRAVRNATVIVTTTQHVRQDVSARLAVPEERIYVAPLGIGTDLRPPADRALARSTVRDLGIEGPYLLYVGGIDPRKNLPFLIDVAERVLAESPAELRLVLAGPLTDDPAWPALEARINASALRERMVLPGFVPNEALPALYGYAEAFLFPSLDEGFGLPPLEAMACGTPVISSPRGALPEVLGEAAQFVDPHDAESWTRATVQLLRSSELRAERVAAGLAHARGFTWDRTARAVAAAVGESLKS